MIKFLRKILNVRKLFLEVLIISLIVGFLGGVVGELFTRAYIFPPESEIEPVLINDLSEEKKKEEKKEKEAKSVAEEMSSALAGIYIKKSPGQKDLLGQVYLPGELRGQGSVLTSDGWILTSSDVLGNLAKDDLAVSVEGKIFTVEEIFKDPASGLAFLKIPAENLAVVKMGELNNFKTGDVVLTLGASGKVFSTTMQDISYQSISRLEDLTRSSEEFSEMVLLADELDTNYLGGPVVSLGGEVIAVIIRGAGGKINLSAPVDYIEPLVFDILRNVEAGRPLLGVNYLDLAESLGIFPEDRQGMERGALLYKNPLSGTPAASVGLKKGDIILKVNNEEVDAKNSLTKLIQEYKPGDKVELVVLRKGEETKVEVELGELK